MARKDDNPWRKSDVRLRDCQIEIKDGISGDRSVTIVASTEDKDRDGDIIRANGWQIGKRVPLLWGHDYRSLPIGRINKTNVRDKKLVVDAEFTPQGLLPEADVVFELTKAGFVNSASVGFIPVEFKPLPDGGLEFTKQELIELSLVPVPANPSAEVIAGLKAKGLKSEAIRKVFPNALVSYQTQFKAFVNNLNKVVKDLQEFVKEIEEQNTFMRL